MGAGKVRKRVQGPVSPISSSHYLSSMNGFWHQRQEKQRPPTPSPPQPSLTHIPNPHPTPSAPQFQGAHQDLKEGDRVGRGLGASREGGDGSGEGPVMR